MEEFFKHLKFAPTIPAAIAFLVLLVVFVILFFGRNVELLEFGFLTTSFPEFYTHVSNLSLSFLIVSATGYFWLMIGVEFRFIAGLGVLFMLLNFVYELFIPVLNTPDIIDAYYGFAGTVIAQLFLVLVYKWGLQENEA